MPIKTSNKLFKAKRLFFSLCSLSLIINTCAHAEQLLVKQPAVFDFTETNSLKNEDPNLTGNDVTLYLISRSQSYENSLPQKNFRVDSYHDCFADSDLRFVESECLTTSPFSEHATAIASLIVGKSESVRTLEQGNFSFESAAPDAKLVSYEFWDFLTNDVFNCEIADDIDLVNMSVGSAMEDWWTRGIDALIEKTGILFVASIGNGGNIIDTPLFPAANPNALGVGVLDSVKTDNLNDIISLYWRTNPEHSNFGPTKDGRCKPDIVSPGNALVAWGGSADGYALSGDFSSFASPVVAGTSCLLLQNLREKTRLDDFKYGDVPVEIKNCLFKSILMTSAEKFPYWHKGQWSSKDDHDVPLDYAYGSGVLNAKRANKILEAGRPSQDNNEPIGWDVSEISGNVEIFYEVRVEGNSADHLNITLCWNRHYEKEYPFDPSFERDIDLRLELWKINENDNSARLVDYSDSPVDNVEHIYFPLSSDSELYEIVVIFSDREDVKKTDLSEHFAVSWSTSSINEENIIYWYDMNGDRQVDGADLSILLGKFGNVDNTTKDSFIGDINIDGVIDCKDALKMMSYEKFQLTSAQNSTDCMTTTSEQ